MTTADRASAQLQRKAFEPVWLRTVVDDGDAGFLIENAEEIAYINRAYAKMLGYDSPAQLRGRHVSTIVAAEDLPRLLTFSRLRIRDEPAPRNYTFTALRRDLSPLRLQATVSATRIEGTVVIATMVLPCERETAPAIAPIPAQAGLRRRLSPRELEVMEMILAGKRMKEIALALDLSPKTVTTHRMRLLQKLHLDSNRDLFQYAVTHNLVDWS